MAPLLQSMPRHSDILQIFLHLDEPDGLTRPLFVTGITSTTQSLTMSGPTVVSHRPTRRVSGVLSYCLHEKLLSLMTWGDTTDFPWQMMRWHRSNTYDAESVVKAKSVHKIDSTLRVSIPSSHTAWVGLWRSFTKDMECKGKICCDFLSVYQDRAPVTKQGIRKEETSCQSTMSKFISHLETKKRIISARYSCLVQRWDAVSHIHLRFTLIVGIALVSNFR